MGACVRVRRSGQRKQRGGGGNQEQDGEHGEPPDHTAGIYQSIQSALIAGLPQRRHFSRVKDGDISNESRHAVPQQVDKLETSRYFAGRNPTAVYDRGVT